MTADAYAEIFLWNQNVDRLVRVLQRLESFSNSPKQELKAYKVRLEEIHAGLRKPPLETADRPGKTNGDGELSRFRRQVQTRLLPQTKSCPRCTHCAVLVDPQNKSLTYTLLIAREFSAA